jgi:hypothetical protein
MRDTFERLLSALEAQKLVREVAPCFSPPSGVEHAKPCSPFAMGEGIYLPPPVFARDSTSSLLGSELSSSSFACEGSEEAGSPGGPASPSSSSGGSSSSSSSSVEPLVRMAQAECHLVNFEGANALASLSASGA